MKFLSITFVTVLIIALSVQVQAKKRLELAVVSPVEILEHTRIETIGEHAFFIINLEKTSLSINHGDKVELVFGFNHKVTVYNVSSENNNAFSNKNELVVFISPEDLRCFNKKTLKKIIIYTENEPVVIKTNIGPDQLKVK